MSKPIDDLLARIRRGLTFAPGTWDRGDMRLLLKKSAAEIERLTAELDAERKFVRDEAKTLMVDMPAPGSDIAKVMRVNAMLRADAAALREALSPFAEAAGLAETSGCPPFQFCDASDYARARAVLKARGGA